MALERYFRKIISPAMIVLLVSLVLVILVIVRSGGDPLVLARLGTLYSQGDSQGTEGYDGQFVYYIARDPDPQTVAPYLDVPAYRYQRILYPLLARLLALGDDQLIPWVLVLINLFALVAGTWALGELLAGWGVSRWFALVYGFWAGFLLTLIVDLPEPLAYGLVVGGILAIERHKPWIGWILLGLSVFAKEVTMLFVAAVILDYLIQRRWIDALTLGSIAVLPFVIFQIWLWSVYGEPGIGSGGAMATPFEWIPFMGILRIGSSSVVYLIAMLLVFGPTVIFPTIWGLCKSGLFFLAGDRNMIVLGLFFNSLVILFLPFSTFRETGGILRFACGLVLAVLLFAGFYRLKKALNYSIFWVVLIVFLFKS
jgi:hypothetical protein